MSLTLVEKIADAVLYEGYILYPYRPSAVKNQQRWNFGALCPRSYSEAQKGTESWTMQTQCLVQTSTHVALNVRVRFLHLLMRTVGELVPDCAMPVKECGHREFPPIGGASHYAFVPALEVNSQVFQSWQEAVEENVQLPTIRLNSPDTTSTSQFSFSYPASETTEPLRDEKTGNVVGILVRQRQAISGTVEVNTEQVSSEVLKITVLISNKTLLEDAGQKSRDDALLRSFVSTHTILGIQGGEFVSLLDPPEGLHEIAGGCSNVGTYPVMVGEEGTRDCMLSSPIILYDYPQIAPESANNLYDGTEIDEILTLRIMTLTEDEKREMRGADERARQLLERTETLPMGQLMKMHGAMKSVKNRES
ncbi:MAG TPA: hypothetical protein VJU86_05470 [Pyrinomonadaceae bacterium]|nr:hypothetical protein [Pyrinomonadaceae bacterium]